MNGGKRNEETSARARGFLEIDVLVILSNFDANMTRIANYPMSARFFHPSACTVDRAKSTYHSLRLVAQVGCDAGKTHVHGAGVLERHKLSRTGGSYRCAREGQGGR